MNQLTPVESVIKPVEPEEIPEPEPEPECKS